MTEEEQKQAMKKWIREAAFLHYRAMNNHDKENSLYYLSAVKTMEFVYESFFGTEIE